MASILALEWTLVRKPAGVPSTVHISAASGQAESEKESEKQGYIETAIQRQRQRQRQRQICFSIIPYSILTCFSTSRKPGVVFRVPATAPCHFFSVLMATSLAMEISDVEQRIWYTCMSFRKRPTARDLRRETTYTGYGERPPLVRSNMYRLTFLRRAWWGKAGGLTLTVLPLRQFPRSGR